MQKQTNRYNRRRFIKTTTTLTAAAVGFAFFPQTACGRDSADDNTNIIGPKKGFSPQVGTLVSMMDWMRMVVLRSVRNLTAAQLDYLHDPKSNAIGAMLLHLAATERYYQLHTFEGKKWGTWDEAEKKRWDVPMGLGEAARNEIRGNGLDYYLNRLNEVREHTMGELKKRDDKWLLAVDKEWSWGPTNNYCKWFHVCEHESNHNGQIKWIRSRLPGSTEAGE
jgi:uncharacterized damage-inducible protein DinB